MSVPSSYLSSTKNSAAIFEAIQKAAVPDKFTYEFLKQLGYSSSQDRPIIPVLKALGFLDDAATPTERYRRYKDKTAAPRVLAQGIRDGYADVFAIDTEANSKNSNELNGIFARLSDKGESVTTKMATTFRFLCSLADFTDGVATVEPETDAADGETGQISAGTSVLAAGSSGALSLRHDIHVHLPLSTDVAVYDAIFRSLKSNLL